MALLASTMIRFDKTRCCPRMRLSLKRCLAWGVGLVLLQLAVYYWSMAIKTYKARKSRVVKPHVYLKELQGDSGTCSFKKCPGVQPDMLNIHFIPHSHIDVGWLKTVDQYYVGQTYGSEEDGYKFQLPTGCVRCTLVETLKELKLDPTRRFIFAEMKYFSRFWHESDNSTKELIQELIKERRLELINGGWVMSDAGVTMYNDLIDQHTLGADFITETFGPCAQPHTAWHVDQFGHSREHASLFSQMGYDSLFVGRIDYQDLDQRKRSKNLEFVWNTSPKNLDQKSTLFTQTTFDGYYAPPRYVFEQLNTRILPDKDKISPYVAQFVRILQDRAKTFATKHLLVPMGSDFGYIQAERWFSNMDNLIKIINAMPAEAGKPKVNIIYSTPSCYTYHVNQENVMFEEKSDDFHPYGIEPGVYWTGYFTTRGGYKFHIKRAGQVLQSCKQLSIFTGLNESFSKVNTLRDNFAVMQHHDAITGTQKKHVLKDYNKLLSEGINQCESVMSTAYKSLWSETDSALPVFTTAIICNSLNTSECPVTEASSPFTASVYNPLAWPVTHWLRVPVTLTDLTITDHRGQALTYQLCPVPKGIQKIPERQSISDVEVVLPVPVPAMTVTPLHFHSSRGGSKPLLEKTFSDAPLSIENEFLKLTFNPETGLLQSITNKVSKIMQTVEQNFLYYDACQSCGSRNSGAYVFVPDSATPFPIAEGGKVAVKVLKGDLVQEVHQAFSPWTSQVIRLYRGENFAEFHWTVGPIEDRVSKPRQKTRLRMFRNDMNGKEVISHFHTSLQTNDVFYTDSNGREMMERQRDFRESYAYQLKDSVSGNYYPITSRIVLKDVDQDIQLTILPDRPQGGSSLKSGDLELMVHRRLELDDGLGVDEALNDDGVDGRGIVFTGKHYLVLDTIEQSTTLVKKLAFQLHLSPTVVFAQTNDENKSKQLMDQRSFLTTALPANVHILTLDRISAETHDYLLLRLEHIFERHESAAMSRNVSISLENLFNTFDIVSAEETTLAGNFHPHNISRLQWKIANGHTPSNIGSRDYKAAMRPPFTIQLEPMEIRTFRVQIARNT